MIRVKKATTSLQRSIKAEATVEKSLSGSQPEEDSEEIKKSVHWLESLFPGCIVILCHMKHLVAPYVSKRCKDILGYEDKEFESFSPEKYFTLIHPDDMEKVLHAFTSIEDIVKKKPFHEIRLIFTYRFKHKRGHYVTLKDERITLLNENKKQVFFILLNKVEHESFNGVTFEALEVTQNGLRKLKTHTSNDNPFTSRELDVVQLIYRGLSNKEIADFLSISMSTVKKHRYSLFKKANAKNSHSLINYAKANNLI